jgi:hypothetical protein
MATALPRFQPLGVQFADLPRVSTASQEAGAQMQQIQAQQFDQIGRAVDRMTAFFQEKAVTEAQKQGLRYAVENPLTKEQVDVALGTEKGLKIKGAGTIFQESYEQAQGQMLSSELQVEGQRQISALAAAIKAGQPVDLGNVQAQLKDLIDGYSSTVMALDPKESVRLRASLATAGSALYKEAADRALLIQREQTEARLNQSIETSGPLIEAVLAKSGTIDSETQKPVDVDQLLEILRKPYYNAIRVTGNSKPIDAFNKKIEEAKVGVLTSAAMSPDFAPNVSASMGKIAKGDFGNLTSVYNSLPNDQKLKVIGNAKTFFSNMEESRRIDEARRKEREKEEGNVLTIEFVNPKTTAVRRQEIVKRMVMIDQMTFPQAQEALKPKAVEANPRLEVDLYQQIKNGRITTIGQLSEYAGRLSNSQYESLGRSIADIQHRNAVEKLTLAAGITDNMFNPGQDKINQKAGYIKEFQRLLAGYKNAQGVTVYPEPSVAAEEAIKNYEKDEANAKRAKKRDTAEKNLKDLLGERMPTGLNIEQINVDTIPNIKNDTRIRAREYIDEYKKNITPAPTNQ